MRKIQIRIHQLVIQRCRGTTQRSRSRFRSFRKLKDGRKGDNDLKSFFVLCAAAHNTFDSILLVFRLPIFRDFSRFRIHAGYITGNAGVLTLFADTFSCLFVVVASLHGCVGEGFGSVVHSEY